MSKKNKLLLIVSLLTVLGFSSCKLIGRTAAKYWTKSQIKQFVSSCETNASRLMSEEKAKNYCDCAIDIVAEKYNNFEDVKKASIREILVIAKDCKQQN